MMNLRGAFVPFAIAGVLAAGACGSQADGTGAAAPATTATTTKPADPKAALAASTKELAAGNYAFKADSPIAKADGSIDAADKSAKLLIDTAAESFKVKFEVALAGTDRWVRITTNGKSVLDRGASPDTWFHVDSTKVKKGGDLDIDLSNADIMDVSALVDAVSDVKADGNTITGKIDGTKVDSADGFLDNDTIKDMAAAGKALPFTATLDDQGRLAELAIDAPAADSVPAGKWTFTVSGYGEQKPQTKPAGTVKEMPASSYSMLNG
ncbi:hypothetical protein ACQP2F_42430 [Actinoplanes sp. CA-030573]|uniref:hypothetical protein n=1 Tax=Actinoplanes sp. CA-030573 TaxID=3239898 RepID=UPI003D902DA8